jgi:hypothetical protein
MDWRNSQLKVLRQSHPITPDQQACYFQKTILPSYSEVRPKQILFSYLENQKLVGYGGLVHIAWEDRRAEVSFLVDPVRASDIQIYELDFSNYLHMIQEIAFEHLGFNRIFTETYDIRPQHIRILEMCGFELEGRLRAHVWIDGNPVDSLLHGCLNLKTFISMQNKI